MPPPLARAKAPAQLKLNPDEAPADEWKMFKQLYKNYEIITQLDKHPKEYQMAVLLNTMGPEGVKLYNDLEFAAGEDKDDTTVLMTKIEEKIKGEVNETYERYVVNCRRQKPDEKIDAYVMSLKDLAKSCGFCDCISDSLLRDRLVIGVREDETRKELLQKRKLKLKDAIDLCRSAESAAVHMKSMEQPTEAAVHKVTPRSKPSRSKNPKAQAKRQNPMVYCKFCGDYHERKKEKCPAWGKKCKKCNADNHFSSCCAAVRSGRKVHTLHEQSDSSRSEEEFVMALSHGDSDRSASASGPIYAEMELNGERIKLQVDCGATVNVIPHSFVKNELEKSAVTLQMWNNSTKTVSGKTRLSLRNTKNQKKYSVEFQVVEGDFTPLLSRKAAETMSLITVNYENFTQLNSVTTKRCTVPDEFPEAFSGELGTLKGKVHLRVDENVTPVQCPPRRVPVALKEPLRKELDRMVKLGVLAPVEDTTPWCSQISIQTKKDGSLRVCIDPRELNKALMRERYPLAIIEDILPELANATVLSKLDLRSRYWHCELDEESSLLTTIITPFGRFRWLRLPFGLNVSSEIFQRKHDDATSTV